MTATPTAPAVTGSPVAAQGAASLLWLYVLIGVLAVAGLAIVISQAIRHRAGRARQWRAMAVSAIAKGSALHDAVSVAGLSGQYGGHGATARWADIERRADDLAQTLYELREAAPGEDERARVDDVLAALYAMRSATQTADSPGGDLNSGNLQTRLQYFDAALQALRGLE